MKRMYNAYKRLIGLNQARFFTMKDTKKVIGLMSGTSANGVDAVLAEITGAGVNSKVRLLEFETYPYSREMKSHILRIVSSSCKADMLCYTNFYLGAVFARAAIAITEKANLKPTDMDIIGSHGQTIYHMPCYDKSSPFGVPSTLQIGEPAVIAEAAGITTVADFRTRDMAAGGIGAPLTPYANFILFSDTKKTKIVQNIGGISNLTLLAGGGDMDSVISFDTGPGNMVIDSIMSIVSNDRADYDKDGSFASRGTVNRELLDDLLAHPFIKKSFPKATGREDFGIHFAKEVYSMSKRDGMKDEDIIASVTAFTVETIISNYEQFIFPDFTPDEIIIAGGGAHNSIIVQMLKKRVGEIKVVLSDSYGIPACALEALSFAILANDTIEGIPNNIPNVTGAKRKVILGKILKG